MNNQNKLFRDIYYKNTNNDIKKHSSFAKFVYDKYIKEINNENVYLKICDVGSGNCRDALFFGETKNMCYAIDINGVLDHQHNNCKFIKDDAESVLKNYTLQTLFDIIYMRWFLHALPYNISYNIFSYALNNLKSNGLICIEVRSINDTKLKNESTYNKDDGSYTTKHKRWLYSMDNLKTLAHNNNCDVIYCEEGHFSPNENTETTDPLLIRFICKKRLLPYYENSENYINYKHIIPKMTYSTSGYEKLSLLNKILETHNIKYVAVAGTALGLNRHGGIIPWDNDIDIGFIEPEWKKLFNIKKALEANGFKYSSNGNSHCHFGPIDCFKLVLKQNVYKGVCGTSCTVDEYKSVVKQIFGYSYVYASFCSKTSLSKRYGKQYFYTGNVNDNFHFKDKSVKNFTLNHNDLSYQLIPK